MKAPKFEYNKETGETKCYLTIGKDTFIGVARCHAEDMDMISEKVGWEISLSRARLKYFQHMKNNVLKPELASLKQLYYSVNRSKHYDPKSYMAKALYSQIQIREIELEGIYELINEERQTIKEYIDTKEELYQKIRKSRNKDNVG